MDFTQSQKKAIMTNGDSLLVTAAAGSGKTTVLSARVTEKLCDRNHPCRADKLMILTYTTAAASEMRSRITKNLTARVKAEPDNGYIKHQLMLLPSAEISTIHSACLNVIRRGFQIIDIDPQFSTVEENDLKIMKETALDDFAEELYDRMETDKSVRDLVTYFSNGKDDKSLRNALDTVSSFLENEPFPDLFIKKYCETSDADIFQTEQGREVYRYVLREFTVLYERYSRIIQISRDNQLVKHIDFYNDEQANVTRVINALKDGDFDKASDFAKECEFKNHISKTKAYGEIHDRLKDERNDIKARFIQLRDGFLYAKKSRITADRKSELEIIRTCLKLCAELNERLLAERKHKRLMSFGDMEKYALKLLISEVKPDGSIVKTELAKSMSEELDEIIVDEYQDCNPTQEYIFNALSKDGKNMFAVGDVKQSIYRFRNADPGIFLKRYNRSEPIGDSENISTPTLISLNQNFRSHPDVLEFVNGIFDKLMTEETCKIDYRHGHRLEKSDIYDNVTNAHTELAFLNINGKNRADTVLTEAEYTAKKIREIISKEKIYDGNLKTTRAVNASDIAILMRAPSKTGACYEKALEREGIGYVNRNPSEKYLDTPVVRDTLSYLQVIDNPYNDIPLVTLMYSRYFGFTADELASIRACARGMLFYDAVKLYAKTDKKAENLITRINKMRNLSLTTDVYGILNAIYEDSGIFLLIDTPSDKANLMFLTEIASEYEKTRYCGLFSFINHIEKLAQSELAVPSAKLKKNDNCVTILSIHKSKGLEYPIVFLADSISPFKFDTANEIMLDKDYGAGGYVRDAKAHVNYSSVFRNYIIEKNRQADTEEYLRLLYVALTRAKTHLYVTAAADEKTLRKLIETADMSGGTPSPYTVSTATSFINLILPCIMDDIASAPLHDFADTHETDFTSKKLPVSIRIYDVGDTDTVETAPVQDFKAEPISPDYVAKMITREYKYESHINIPAKLSVSEIKEKKLMTGETVTDYEKHSNRRRPRFMTGDVRGTDRGNATHTFLQYCDFKAVTDMPSLMSEKSRLFELEFMTEKELELVDYDKVLRFLQSDVMTHLNSLSACKKEDRFLFTLPACDVTDTDANEQVIVQGIIDCWYEENGQAVIVDYKTDYVKTPDELVSRYKTQLDLYERAIYSINGLKTKEKYIYSFSLEQFIKL